MVWCTSAKTTVWSRSITQMAATNPFACRSLNYLLTTNKLCLRRQLSSTEPCTLARRTSSTRRQAGYTCSSLRGEATRPRINRYFDVKRLELVAPLDQGETVGWG